MQGVWKELKRPWSDQVKGSWWKAPLLIAAYFYVRVLAETWVIRRGALNAEVELTVETLTEGNLLNLMTHAPMEYFLQTLGLTVLIIVTGKLLGFKFFDFKTFTWQNIATALKIYVFIYLLQVLLNIITMIAAPDYVQPGNQTAVESLVQNMSPILMFINIVILTPITEEYILRGLIMKYTFSLMPIIGAFVAAVIFTMLHGPANWIDFMVYFVLSAGFTFVYLYTRRLEYPILLHIIQNFIGFMAIQML